MKKRISMLLVLVMSVLLLAGCGGGTAGTYKAVRVEINGEEKELESFSELAGAEFTVTLGEDGKAEMYAKVNGKEQTGSGTWTEEDDKVLIKNENAKNPVTYEKKDGSLLVEFNGVKLIFEK